MRNCVKKHMAERVAKNLLLLLCAYVPPYVVNCNIFVLYCSWQSYLRTYLLTSVVL